jgi:hypothetical protein
VPVAGVDLGLLACFVASQVTMLNILLSSVAALFFEFLAFTSRLHDEEHTRRTPGWSVSSGAHTGVQSSFWGTQTPLRVAVLRTKCLCPVPQQALGLHVGHGVLVHVPVLVCG